MRLLPSVAPVLCVVAVVAACGGEAPGPRTSEAATASTANAGVNVELPPGWHGGTPADGLVVDPLTRVVASSAPVRPREAPCQIARYAPPPSDVTLVVVEWKRSAEARAEPRPDRFDRKTLPLHPPPAIECFDGRGGSAQFVDHGRVFAAYLLVGSQAPQALVEEALGVLNTLQVSSPRGVPRRVARNGVSLAVPDRWDGRMLFRDARGSWGVIFQVANFELPPNERFEPPQELPLGQEDPIKAMDAGDVLITVIADEATGEPAPETITLEQLTHLPMRAPSGHALAEGSFCFGARCVRIEVDFGGPPEPELERSVDRVLASLEVDAVAEAGGRKDTTRNQSDPGPRGCPRESWPGPWTACAEAEWVSRIVREAGYRVAGETGSALVAEGNGRSFHVWTTPALRSAVAIAETGNWRRLAVIDGVSIYGDDDLWRFWQAQGFTFWIKEGPRADSLVPSPAELAPLVDASTLVPPPAR